MGFFSLVRSSATAPRRKRLLYLPLIILSSQLLSSHTLSQALDEFNPGANQNVAAVACQSDGRIWVGGAFTTLANSARKCVDRLNPDGTLDPTPELHFAGQSLVNCLALQPDGKVLVGGWFIIPGHPLTNICRLNADGSLDSSFSSSTGSQINSLVVQPDGKILVAGYFSTIASQPRQSLGRLLSDGSLDASFQSDAPGHINTIALQRDGKILVGGSFVQLGGVAQTNLGRLNPNGSVDLTFSAAPDSEVSALALQPNGQILLAGSFSFINGQQRVIMGRLNSDGTLDPIFNPQPNGMVNSIALQSDGKIFAAGLFRTIGGQPTTNLARLNPDGTGDSSFSTTSDQAIQALAQQADGKLIVAGYFTSIAGQPRSSIARFNSEVPAIEALSSDGATITWQRSGSSPELQRSAFEFSSNHIDWQALGYGSPTPGGWELTGLSIPHNSSVKAIGFISGGYYAGSEWMINSFVGPPAIGVNPFSRTNIAGTLATFSVVGGGSATLSYTWLKYGAPFSNGPNISGASTSFLMVSNVLGADAGGYSVILSNSFGSVTSSVANLTVIDPSIIRQPISQSVAVGQPSSLDVVATGTSPLTYYWRKQGSAIPGATAAVQAFANVQTSDAGYYDVIVSNAFGVATSAVCSLTVNQAIMDDMNPGFDYYVYCSALQRDGKILVGGPFANPRVAVARLNTAGTVDSSFSLTFSNAYSFTSVNALAVQDDDKIIIGGVFYGVNGGNWTNIARLNPDGTLDAGFNPGANSNVLCLALQSDGKILVGGQFTRLGGQVHNRIGRLNANGTIDGTFNAGVNADPALGIPVIQGIALLDDGRILVCGWFTEANGVPRKCLARLNANGTLDDTFDAGDSGPMICVAVQPNGQYLVGGQFSTLDGQPYDNIGRLNPDGSLDSDFHPIANELGVMDFLLQADGRILVGGGFTNMPGQSRNYIERLNPDGSLDTSFDPGADNYVYTVSLQSDGRIIAGGLFSNLGGLPRSRLGRIFNTTPPTQSVTLSNSFVTWLRGGTCAEAYRTRFEVSTNGSDLIDLGSGTRVPGGWQRSGAFISSNATIRCRAYFQTGSTWFEELISGQAFFSTQPLSLTNYPFTQASFSAEVGGTGPFSFRWLKNGVPLSNGGNIAAATTPTLLLSNVLGSDNASYSLIASNSFGTVTSKVATLTVIDPFITSSPVDRIGNQGQTIMSSRSATHSVLPLAHPLP